MRMVTGSWPCPNGTRYQLLAPVVAGKKGHPRQVDSAGLVARLRPGLRSMREVRELFRQHSSSTRTTPTTSRSSRPGLVGP